MPVYVPLPTPGSPAQDPYASDGDDRLRPAETSSGRDHPHARCPLLRPLGPTTVPLGKQIIISTGKLYFSRCKPASCLWSAFSCWTCEEQCYFLVPGPHDVLGMPQAAPPDPLLTCRSSSSFTRDQVLMKLSLRSVRMGGLSRTVSRRVRPEPVRGKAKGEQL